MCCSGTVRNNSLCLEIQLKSRPALTAAGWHAEGRRHALPKPVKEQEHVPRQHSAQHGFCCFHEVSKYQCSPLPGGMSNVRAMCPPKRSNSRRLCRGGSSIDSSLSALIELGKRSQPALLPGGMSKVGDMRLPHRSNSRRMCHSGTVNNLVLLVRELPVLTTAGRHVKGGRHVPPEAVEKQLRVPRRQQQPALAARHVDRPAVRAQHIRVKRRPGALQCLKRDLR